jgi:hypothetical protein
MLKVEQVLGVLHQQSCCGTKVRALEVRDGLKALLPHGVSLISNREKHDRHACCSSETILT